QLRNRGHTVHTPDLFEGRTFATVEEGMGYAESLGLEQVIRRGIEAAGELPKQAVFSGFSIGVLPAQQLLQTTPEALGGLFLHSFVDPEFLPGSWPSGCPVQVHGRDHDPFFAGEGDLEAARAVQSEHPELEIVLHAGHGHLFTDSSTADYDESAAADVLARLGTFLAGIDAGDPPAGPPATEAGAPGLRPTRGRVAPPSHRRPPAAPPARACPARPGLRTVRPRRAGPIQRRHAHWSGHWWPSPRRGSAPRRPPPPVAA